MVSHDLLKRFSAGIQRFQKTWYCPENNIYEDLRVGQHPYALVIACSDSRVDPVLLLDATPGDLFVIRNVANLVPPYEPDSHHHGVSAALEYAVRHLHIGHIKAIYINYTAKKQYNGKFNLRYDDTNPVKEDVEYVDSIKEDVNWLGFQWAEEHYASDYFEQLYDWAVELIRKGKAYVDDQSQEEIRLNRGTVTVPGKESPWRNRSVEENARS